MINWQYIMIHHSLTADGQTVNWDAIRRYHKEVMGWNDIGYHFGIELVGNNYAIQIGRPLSIYGAHCKEGGMNRQAIGICCVGNFDVTPPPQQQLECLASLVRQLMEQFQIPSERIVRHTDYAPYKTCPGRLFPWRDFLRQLCPSDK